MSKTCPAEVVAGLTKSTVPLPDVLSNVVNEAVPAVVIETRHNRPTPTFKVFVDEPLAMNVRYCPPELTSSSPILDACTILFSNKKGPGVGGRPFRLLARPGPSPAPFVKLIV
jgi:hypothetical protein